MTDRLRTMGHATLVLERDGASVLATDPWLVGSTYWRSWWLAQNPRPDEFDAVAKAEFLYVTHSHPDHFHWPSIRRLKPKRTLHPTFPGYVVPGFVRDHGIDADVLVPWRWYDIGGGARIASVPVPIDDSILVIDTPDATIVNINDAVARPSLLRAVRRRLCTPGKHVVALRSYSPASVSASMYRDGARLPFKSKRDYVRVAREAAELVGASHFVPFASQAVFLRSDSEWATEFKVTFDDLRAHWGDSRVTLLPPHIDLELATMTYVAREAGEPRRPALHEAAKVGQREAEERAFAFGERDEATLERYLQSIPFLGVLYRRGLAFRLSTSGRELRYDTRKKALVEPLGVAAVTITVPDAVLAEAARNGVMTDLGITMLVRVDTTVHLRLAYGLFLLMGLRDYGHLRSPLAMARFALFYGRQQLEVVRRGPAPAAGRLRSLTR